MDWAVDFHEALEDEFADWPDGAKIELAAMVGLLKEFGPHLGRPHADTLNGSRHANMKELRFKAADGAWRVAFAFDPERHAILLVGGDKSGSSEKRFYRQLLERADRRFQNHLDAMKGRI